MLLKVFIITGISSRYIFVDRGRMTNMFKIRNIEKNTIYLKKWCVNFVPEKVMASLRSCACCPGNSMLALSWSSFSIMGPVHTNSD